MLAQKRKKQKISDTVLYIFLSRRCIIFPVYLVVVSGHNAQIITKKSVKAGQLPVKL